MTPYYVIERDFTAYGTETFHIEADDEEDALEGMYDDEPYSREYGDEETSDTTCEEADENFQIAPRRPSARRRLPPPTPIRLNPERLP